MQLPFMKRRDAASKTQAVKGLPPVRYRLPIVVTILWIGVILAVLAFLTLVAWANTVSSATRMGTPEEGAGFTVVFVCGVFGVVGILGTAYFAWAAVKGLRDLTTPVQYTRGALADKRGVGGRMVGNWVALRPAYVGPDLDRASAITDEQASASVDRRQIVQTRATTSAAPPNVRKGYLTPGRISSNASLDPSAPVGSKRAVFRLEPPPFAALSQGDEVIVAHSRYLEHIYFVAHLRDGEWESFPAKQLI